jgi:hypothetical protein
VQKVKCFQHHSLMFHLVGLSYIKSVFILLSPPISTSPVSVSAVRLLSVPSPGSWSRGRYFSPHLHFSCSQRNSSVIILPTWSRRNARMLLCYRLQLLPSTSLLSHRYICYTILHSLVNKPPICELESNIF